MYYNNRSTVQIETRQTINTYLYIPMYTLMHVSVLSVPTAKQMKKPNHIRV